MIINSAQRLPEFRNRFAVRMMLSAVLSIVAAAGCGTMVKRQATEQLLTSDAVDRTIAQFDFGDLSGKTVYLDTQYIPPIKGIGFVNADYIISSLRQQLVAAHCLLQDEKETADYIVEARVGALGLDSHEITYGIPASNALSTAASLVPTAPPLPTIPEISFAKKKDQMAAAKIAVFAYNRKTRQPVWQSGVNKAKSIARDTWILGAGPFQRGTIYQGTQFAGTRLGIPFVRRDRKKSAVVSYRDEVHFHEQPRKPKLPIPSGINPLVHDDNVLPASGTSVPGTSASGTSVPVLKTGSSTESRPNEKPKTSERIQGAPTSGGHREPARLFIPSKNSDHNWKPRLPKSSGVLSRLPSLVPRHKK